MAESEGVSTRYLLGAFFAVVLLCAVFFSLGYFLGYREGRPPGTPITEHVAASSDAPPPLNGPSNASSAAEPGGTPPSEAQSTQPSNTAADTEAAPPEPMSPAQSTSAVPAGSPATSRSTANPTPPQSTEDAGTGGASDSSSASGVGDSALSPGSVPSGILIQVGAVSSRPVASQMADALRGQGYPARVLTPAQVGAKDTFFRVVAGPYRNHGAAETALRKLVKDGYRPFIRQ